MPKAQLNNALNDWFTTEPTQVEENQKQSNTKTVTPPTSSKRPKKIEEIVNFKDSNKESSQNTSLPVNQQASNELMETQEVPRIKFSSYIRKDLLQKLKIKSVQTDQTIIELIEEAIQAIV
jgi:hypothetical protein